MLLQIARFPFLLRLNNMPLNRYTKFPLSDHPLMDISVASTSWLLEIVLQWTWLWKNHFEFLLSINLDIHWKMKLLNHVVILFFKFLRNLHNVSHRSAPFLLYSHQLCTSILISPDPRQLSLFPLPFPSLYSSPPYFSVFFFWNRPPKRVWGNILLWFWFGFQMISEFEPFSYACWPFVYFLWKYVYSTLCQF